MTSTLTAPGRDRMGSTGDSMVAIGRATSLDEVGPPEGNGSVDFYGNEVNAAVARYKVDPSGVVYEEHSPQTEVPRLGSPKS